MINVTEQIIVPMMGQTIFAKNDSPSQRKMSLSVAQGIKLWQDIISVVQKSEEKDLIKVASKCTCGLISIDLRRSENMLSSKNEKLNKKSRIVLKRGQVFHFDLYFDRDFHSKTDITVSIINEENCEKVVSLFGSISLEEDEEESNENFVSIKFNIPSHCTLGNAKLEISTECIDNISRQKCSQTFTVLGISIIE